MSAILNAFNWQAALTSLESIAVIAAAWVAVSGINAWRREATGMRKIALAEEVLTSAYEAREVIHYLRNPAGFAGEGKKEMLDAEGAVGEVIPPLYVIRYRMSQTEVFNKLHAVRYRLMTYLGEEAGEPIADLATTVREIQLAAWRATNWTRQLEESRDPSERAQLLERLERADNVLYRTGEAPDEIEQRVDSVIARLEERVEPLLRERGWI